MTKHFDFIVELKPKGYDTFKVIKTFFGKKKKVKASKNDFFNFSANLFNKEKVYTVCPSIYGLSMENYLREKAIYNNKHFFSDFNQRISWSIEIISEECELLENLGETKPVYVYNLVCNIRGYYPNGKLFIEQDGFNFKYTSYFKYTKRYIELLFQNACNGIYQTARDVCEFYEELNKSANKTLPIWGCDTCNERFYNLDEFYCHLIDEGHDDGIFTSHPFDKEAQRVKQLVANKIARKEKSSE